MRDDPTIMKNDHEFDPVTPEELAEIEEICKA